jgi:hypothetical protein
MDSGCATICFPAHLRNDSFSFFIFFMRSISLLSLEPHSSDLLETFGGIEDATEDEEAAVIAPNGLLPPNETDAPLTLVAAAGTVFALDGIPGKGFTLTGATTEGAEVKPENPANGFMLVVAAGGAVAFKL